MNIKDVEEKILRELNNVESVTFSSDLSDLTETKQREIEWYLTKIEIAFMDFIKNQQELDASQIRGIEQYMESITKTLSKKFERNTSVALDPIGELRLNAINNKVKTMKTKVIDKAKIINDIISLKGYEDMQNRKKRIEEKIINKNEKKIDIVAVLADDLRNETSKLKENIQKESVETDPAIKRELQNKINESKNRIRRIANQKRKKIMKKTGIDVNSISEENLYDYLADALMNLLEETNRHAEEIKNIEYTKKELGISKLHAEVGRNGVLDEAEYTVGCKYTEENFNKIAHVLAEAKNDKKIEDYCIKQSNKEYHKIKAQYDNATRREKRRYRIKNSKGWGAKTAAWFGWRTKEGIEKMHEVNAKNIALQGAISDVRVYLNKRERIKKAEGKAEELKNRFQDEIKVKVDNGEQLEDINKTELYTDTTLERE